MVPVRSFPYLPVAMLFPAVPALLAHYTFGEPFLLSVGVAWALVSVAALVLAFQLALDSHAAKGEAE